MHLYYRAVLSHALCHEDVRFTRAVGIGKQTDNAIAEATIKIHGMRICRVEAGGVLDCAGDVGVQVIDLRECGAPIFAIRAQHHRDDPGSPRRLFERQDERPTHSTSPPICPHNNRVEFPCEAVVYLQSAYPAKHLPVVIDSGEGDPIRKHLMDFGNRAGAGIRAIASKVFIHLPIKGRLASED